MQTTAYYATPLPPPPMPPADPVRTSVTHLLGRAYNIPCTAAAQAFSQLVQPTSRFQLALEALLPLLQGHAEIPQRILSSYILYALYATHPITMNPFRTAFIEVFTQERDVAKQEADRGGVSENEQLVWVLWKILKGDGNDLGPYSPNTLARSPLPPKLRAPYLTVDDGAPPGIPDDAEVLAWPSNANGREGGASPSEPSQKNTSSIAEAARRDDSFIQGVNLLMAACIRVLTLAEQRIVAAALPNIPSTSAVSAKELPTLVAHNPMLAHPFIVTVLRSRGEGHAHNLAAIRASYIDALKLLPPTLPSLDVLGRLLRDTSTVAALGDHTGAGESANAKNGTPGMTTVAELVRTEVLGAFVLNAIGWVERAETDEMEGLINDDRVPKAVQNLCRFYHSLIKLKIVDPKSDTDSAAMAHFSLSHARFEEANELYRVFVMSKF